MLQVLRVVTSYPRIAHTIGCGPISTTLPHYIPPNKPSSSSLFLFSIFFHIQTQIQTNLQMGNCQAIDNATLVIQHPSGKVHHLFKPVTVSEIMTMNPGHYVAVLLATTLYSSSAAAGSLAVAAENDYASRARNSNVPLRVTRIKLLRPTDSLVLGQVYRLVTAQEVMKGLGAKKLAKMKQDQQQKITGKHTSDFDSVVRRTDVEKTKQVNHGRQKSRNNTSVNAASRHRTWQPALNSISESAS